MSMLDDLTQSSFRDYKAAIKRVNHYELNENIQRAEEANLDMETDCEIATSLELFVRITDKQRESTQHKISFESILITT